MSMAAVNYVDRAEQVIKRLIKTKERRQRGTVVTVKEIDLTTNQIRKFLATANMIANKVSTYKARHPGERELPEELVGEIQYMRVKLVYQAGRERAVREFIEISELDKYIQQIGSSIKEFENFSRYVEALVAYHKFYGGKDK